jgi:hypothetical protein
MPKWSLRDLRAKRTEKKALAPGMREMLMELDGVYEREDVASPAPKRAAVEEQPSSHEAEERAASASG